MKNYLIVLFQSGVTVAFNTKNKLKPSSEIVPHNAENHLETSE